MARVFLSLGSNIRREYYLRSGIAALRANFGELLLSSVYESDAVGFEGDPFLNMVVGIETSLPLDQLFDRLRQIEHEHDRCRDAAKFSSRTLDIDILTYDDYCGAFCGGELPRAEITQNAFVLWPLAEVAGEQIHPALQQSYRALWARFSGSRALAPIEFSWSRP